MEDWTCSSLSFTGRYVLLFNYRVLESDPSFDKKLVTLSQLLNQDKENSLSIQELVVDLLMERNGAL